MRTLEQKIEQAVRLLRGLNTAELEDKRYDVDEDFFYTVLSYETKLPEQNCYESHRKYVDIQYIIEGIEQISVAPLEGMEIKVAYDEKKDIGFYDTAEGTATFVLTRGGYAVLYPKDAHKPGVCVDKPAYVRKIVGKVKI